jgi:uncharacterized protein (DUF1800 family)
MTMKRRLTLSALVGAIMVIIGSGGAGAPKLNLGVGTSSSLPQPAPPPLASPPVRAPQPLFPDKPASRADAARFLNQATFGATSAEVDRLMSIGYTAWIDEQFAMPRKQTFSNWYNVDGPASNPTDYGDPNSDRESAAWFTVSTQEPDQLRLRTAWALSQIFVVSRNKVGPHAIHWMDLTADASFGTYRALLERATFSPVMARYLDYMNNTDHNGNAPDQNYAREVMQLFSIGLWQLNSDGTLKLDAMGARIPTYSQADVTGLSYVFTGLRMQYGGDRYGTCRDPAGNLLGPTTDENKLIRCELSVWDFASTREHNFLGVKIAAISPNSTATAIQANGRKNIGIALDTLANHPNTAPFISKQLIQRFTTSNPSPAYVSRVVAKFENNGQGVRGDLRAVIKQILLDPEARVTSAGGAYEFGKVREPILAIAQLNRVLKANDGKGNVWAGASGCKVYFDIISEMERPYNSATVFNYYRPSFSPANGRLAAQNLAAPEMQITDTNAAHDWSRFVQQALQRGGTGCGKAAKVQNTFSYSEFWTESTDAEKLTDKVLTLFAPGAGLADLKPALVRSINSLPTETDADRTNRIKLAIMMTMLTPEYRVQR